MERARKFVESNSHNEGRLLPRILSYHLFAGNSDECEELTQLGVAISRREGDLILESRVLSEWIFANTCLANQKEYADRLSRLEEIVWQVEDNRVRAYGHAVLCYTSMQMGKLTEAKKHASVQTSVVQKYRDPYLMYGPFSAQHNHLMHALITGDWQLAICLSKQIMVSRKPDKATGILIRRLIAEFESGSDEFISVLNQYFDDLTRQGPGGYENARMVAPYLARITGKRCYLEYFDKKGIRRSFSPEHRARIPMALGLCAVVETDVQAARENYEEMMKLARPPILCPFTQCTSFRVLGILATAIGKIDEAVSHFEKGYSFCKKAGYRPELAWTCCDWADAFIKRGTNDDLVRAKDLLQEGILLTQNLNMHPLSERVTERLNKLKKTSTRPDSLTQREVEILHLIGMGKTNKEIASKLFVRVQTVANHLTRIYSKTGTGNRTEAAIYAHRKDISLY